MRRCASCAPTTASTSIPDHRPLGGAPVGSILAAGVSLASPRTERVRAPTATCEALSTRSSSRRRRKPPDPPPASRVSGSRVPRMVDIGGRFRVWGAVGRSERLSRRLATRMPGRGFCRVLGAVAGLWRWFRGRWGSSARLQLVGGLLVQLLAAVVGVRRGGCRRPRARCWQVASKVLAGCLQTWYCGPFAGWAGSLGAASSVSDLQSACKQGACEFCDSMRRLSARRGVGPEAQRRGTKKCTRGRELRGIRWGRGGRGRRGHASTSREATPVIPSHAQPGHAESWNRP
ncbi:hypothetical protein RS84_00004 [Microbacterium hydrocarbonoxydans]|uniref:Uncharacterized protein n=1 Tax=Microbacterium hydrocarbonoxydans TaxID=273678 RepID=A0A0M2HX76_9MICO|nr:hypothetical protein RS84_00004 [Microbacterium hydrocarbonoxydans]